MAEAIVGVLIVKLGAALASQAEDYGAFLLDNEASALKGLFGEIRKAKEELESMKAYLHESEKFKDTNETIGIFINKIRELSFQIEDVVDEFMYKIEDNKHAGLLAKLTRRIKHVKVWHRLAHKLHDILAEIEDATKRKDRYVIPGMQGYAGSNGHHARPTNQNLCFAREDDLVGIEDNATKLKHWLVGDLEERNTRVTTVWGMGGVGKTTLVDHVYNIVKVEFDTAAWVTVSKSYQIEDLLKRTALAFSISIDSSIVKMRTVVEVIHKHLEGKRYILVLDNVWKEDVWVNIMNLFLTNYTSQFVLTSRLSEVASLATNNCTIMLEPLQENHSSMLFCKLAFRNNEDKKCPLELWDLTAKFLEKCGGLPIAITCIGRLLSCKPETYSEWEKVYQKLELQSIKTTIPGVDAILKVSLEDLPYELKNCFLHCTLFPEDYELRRRRLIKHWITSGFINNKENSTLEEVAEGYLNDLIDRSLLQVVQKNEFERVKKCQVHDLIRHLAIEKAEIESFGKVYAGSRTFSTGNTRRVSIKSSKILSLSQSGATHLRAIYAFTSSLDIELLRPILASSNLLTTLDLQGTQIKILPNEVFNLFNLRFLGLRFTAIEVLPEEIGRLQNLEVLDALCTSLLYLPNSVEKLKKLRFLYAGPMVEEGPLRYFSGVRLPRGIRNLTSLHVLQEAKASFETLCDVAALTELRTFSVCNVLSKHASNLCSAITNMGHLTKLSIEASNENEVLPLEALCLPGTLTKLELTGQLEKKRMPQILSSWSHLTNLKLLFLRFSRLDEDSFSSLMVLHGLQCLELGEAYIGKTLYFPSQAFPRLRVLRIWGAPQINQVIIDEGALASLVKLELSDCENLKCLPQGIEYLRTLEVLFLQDIAEELVEKLRDGCKENPWNKELQKIIHIRKVVVKLTKKKTTLRIC